jgi:hypothetical protein
MSHVAPGAHENEQAAPGGHAALAQGHAAVHATSQLADVHVGQAGTVDASGASTSASVVVPASVGRSAKSSS